MSIDWLVNSPHVDLLLALAGLGDVVLPDIDVVAKLVEVVTVLLIRSLGWPTIAAAAAAASVHPLRQAALLEYAAREGSPSG